MDAASSCSLVIAPVDDESELAGGAAPSSPTYYYSTNRRRASYRAMPLSGGAAAGFFCDAFSEEEPRHFLDSCFLCRKPLDGNHDIFMYRGDTPFCSEECRQEQIDIDESQERMKNSSSSSWKTQQNKITNATSSPKSQKMHVRATGTVVAG